MDLPTLFSALSDANRFAIVERLMAEGELTAGSIGKDLPISAPAISRHLNVLHGAGLVTRRVNRQQRLYSVRPEAIQSVSDWVMDHRKFWAGSLDKLEEILQSPKENQ